MKALYPGTGEVRIPASAVLDSRGRAAVLCPDARGRVWAETKVRPRRLFVCPSGFVGRVLVRRR